jgi:hypothetical protein
MRGQAKKAKADDRIAARLPASAVVPTGAQRRYLERGLSEPGGKLPLFDDNGREISRRTIEACVAHGWAEAWIRNPVKLDWLVCRLTAEGYRALGEEPPARPESRIL